MNIKQSNYIEEINAKSYLTENSNIDEIFEGISKSNFDSEELKKFIQDNIDFFSSDNFRKKLIEKGTKLKNKNDMIMIIFLITFIDSINEQNSLNTNIQNEISKTKNLIDQIIKQNEEQLESYNKKQELITKKAEQLEETIKELENEIAEYRILIKRQSDNLKEKIILIDELNKKEEQLIKALKQSHELVKEGKGLGIFIEVANSKGELRINTTAIDAVKKQTIHISEQKNYSVQNDGEKTSHVIKAGDEANIKPFRLKQILDETNENTELVEEQEYSGEDIKKMMDRIYELEEQAKKDSKKIKTLSEKTEKQTKKIKKLESENKKLKDENESLNKTIIISGGSKISRDKKED